MNDVGVAHTPSYFAFFCVFVFRFDLLREAGFCVLMRLRLHGAVGRLCVSSGVARSTSFSGHARLLLGNLSVFSVFGAHPSVLSEAHAVLSPHSYTCFFFCYCTALVHSYDVTE